MTATRTKAKATARRRSWTPTATIWERLGWIRQWRALCALGATRIQADALAGRSFVALSRWARRALKRRVHAIHDRGGRVRASDLMLAGRAV